MSYKVLARKWRPQHFRDMLGQEPVLRALTNALDTNRLHHAYLFTGMRGVGKTSIARIFAKCLNCETNGVSSSPCGECSACRDIEAGRHLDLIEVDAASNSKVDETRELLEDVSYTPASGRYKVYLIDEVHMFSKHSFNALLKTLEEPPEHVVFLLATTDPQGLPLTVLSRCLQFNLKRMVPGLLANYLSTILEKESIEFDRPALDLIARASEGSVRDSLSLVEQAAAFGQGAVRLADVESMLGRASVDSILGLIESLGNADLPQLFSRVETLAEYSPDFVELMDEILSLLHRVALLQTVPGSVSEDTPGYERLTRLAEDIHADELQLFYQIGTHARRDMPLAADPREVFDMALLRMNTFRPQVDGDPGMDSKNSEGPASTNTASGKPQRANVNAAPVSASLPVRGEVSAGGALRAAALAAARGEAAPTVPVPTPAQPAVAPVAETATESAVVPGAEPVTGTATESAVVPGAEPVTATVTESAVIPGAEPVTEMVTESAVVADAESGAQTTTASLVDRSDIQPRQWHQIVSELDVSGMPKQLASNSELVSAASGHITLRLESASEHLNSPRFRDRLESALSQWLDIPAKLEIVLEDARLNTPARIDKQKQSDEMAAARASIGQDPVVRQLIERVDGAVDESSIAPMDER